MASNQLTKEDVLLIMGGSVGFMDIEQLFELVQEKYPESNSTIAELQGILDQCVANFDLETDGEGKYVAINAILEDQLELEPNDSILAIGLDDDDPTWNELRDENNTENNTGINTENSIEINTGDNEGYNSEDNTEDDTEDNTEDDTEDNSEDESSEDSNTVITGEILLKRTHADKVEGGEKKKK